MRLDDERQAGSGTLAVSVYLDGGVVAGIKEGLYGAPDSLGRYRFSGVNRKAFQIIRPVLD